VERIFAGAFPENATELGRLMRRVPRGGGVLRVIIVVGLLLLVVANVAWAATLGRATPVVGAFAYGVVAYHVVRRGEDRAAFLVGLAGGILHLLEFLRSGSTLPELDRALALANVAVPFVVAGFGMAAWRPWRARAPGRSGS